MSAAIRKTGIYPFDRTVTDKDYLIPAELFAPASTETATDLRQNENESVQTIVTVKDRTKPEQDNQKSETSWKSFFNSRLEV